MISPRTPDQKLWREATLRLILPLGLGSKPYHTITMMAMMMMVMVMVMFNGLDTWCHNLNDDGDDDDQWVSSITSSEEKTRTNEKLVENQPEVKSGKRGRLSQGSALHCSPWSYNSLW